MKRAGVQAYRSTPVDGVVCQWHTAGTDRSGAQQGTVYENLDVSDV